MNILLSVDAYAEDGDGVLDTIVVVCDAACQDQGGGGSGGTHGSGDTPVGGEGDGSQTGGGGGIEVPHVGNTLPEPPTDPQRLKPSSCSGSTSEVRLDYANYSVGFSRARNSNPLFKRPRPTEVYTLEYNNGLKEFWTAGNLGLTLEAGFPIPNTCHD